MKLCRLLTLLIASFVVFLTGNMPQIAVSADKSAETIKHEKTAGQDVKIVPALAKFPRTVELSKGRLTVFEPQIEGHTDFKEASAWSAAYFVEKGATKKSYGTIKFHARLHTDFEERTVTIYEREIRETYFPEVKNFVSSGLEAEIKKSVQTHPVRIPLDVLLGYLSEHAADAKSVGVSFEAPNIVYASAPTMLVNIDGKPIMVPIVKDNELKLIVNTNWDLFYSEKSDLYFLLLGSSWIESKSLSGKWNPGYAPNALKNLPDEKRWAKVKAAIPGTAIKAEKIPHIVVSKVPTELIVTDGAPQLDPIEGTTLSFIKNTSSDVIFDQGDKHYYFLTSGRWFKAKKITGPWAGIKTAPESFAAIPADHVRSHVRSSISGTVEANYATVQAQIPTTAEVSRETKAPEIRYAGGAPEFVEISGTGVARAKNTNFDVLLIGQVYYLCYEAIWFTSPGPTGPWRVADSVPKEVYNIPASSPSHHVTYVTVYQSSPSTVYMGYTAGYHHSYISFGVVVYGSGFYSPYHYNPYSYPWYPYWYYRPYYPYSYGHASYYNPVTGAYGHGHYAYGPYGGGMRAAERYNPRTGRYSQSVAAWDYNSGVYAGRSYSPRTGIGIETEQAIQYGNNNRYESWGETVVSRGDEWIRSERTGNEQGFRRDIESSRGGQAVQLGSEKGKATALKTGDGDLYAGANGNVFRRTEEGGWEKRDSGDWSPIESGKLKTEAQKYGQELTPNQKTALQNRPAMGTPEQRKSAKDYGQKYGPPQSTNRNWQTNESRTRQSTFANHYNALNRAQRARTAGNQRYQNFQNYRRKATSSSRSGRVRRR